MLVQRLIRNIPKNTAALIIEADDLAAIPELLGLADELNLRSTIRTEGTIHHLNDPAGNGDPNPKIV
jgi:hypothetical protein